MVRVLIRSTLLLGAASVLLLVVWGAAFVWWHFRINRAMLLWEQSLSTSGFNRYWRQSGAPPEADRILNDAGCRALPYMIRRLSGSGTRLFKWWLVNRVIQCLAGTGPRTPGILKALNERYEAWDYSLSQTSDRQEERLARVRAWWSQNATHHHQWWRIWSPRCPGLCDGGGSDDAGP